MSIEQKLNELKIILEKHNKIIVALSGGVDSAFLLAFSHIVLGKNNVIAITAKGPHIAPDEVEYSSQLCNALNIKHIIKDISHVLPIIADNPLDRCYTCKKNIFSCFNDEAMAINAVLMDGTNLDDMSDYRPGHKALAEFNVISPLRDASFTKEDIRASIRLIAKSNDILSSAFILDDGTPLWEKPAFACLASRIPYDNEITVEKLSTIYKSEVYMRSLGLKQVRVRHHGELARIEVPTDMKHFFFDDEIISKVNTKLHEYGFKYVTLDLEGYKMGGGFNS